MWNKKATWPCREDIVRYDGMVAHQSVRRSARATGVESACVGRGRLRARGDRSLTCTAGERTPWLLPSSSSTDRTASQSAKEPTSIPCSHTSTTRARRTLGINVYSFALRPEEHQPSGTCNMSRIDNATLQLVLSNNTIGGEDTAKRCRLRDQLQCAPRHERHGRTCLLQLSNNLFHGLISIKYEHYNIHTLYMASNTGELVLIGVVLIFSSFLILSYNSGTFVAPPQREIVVVQPRPPGGMGAPFGYRVRSISDVAPLDPEDDDGMW